MTLTDLRKELLTLEGVYSMIGGASNGRRYGVSTDIINAYDKEYGGMKHTIEEKRIATNNGLLCTHIIGLFNKLIGTDTTSIFIENDKLKCQVDMLYSQLQELEHIKEDTKPYWLRGE